MNTTKHYGCRGPLWMAEPIRAVGALSEVGAGGKRWLLSQYPWLLPEHYNRYFEPFLGSGSVFFHLLPKSAILADTNSELIELFGAIRGVPSALRERSAITLTSILTSTTTAFAISSRARRTPKRRARSIKIGPVGNAPLSS